jgi:hypothetical protein
MRSITILVFLALATTTYGTHIRAGYISAKPISCLEYEITLRIFTDTSSPVRFGDGELNFGDGSKHTTSDRPNTFPPELYGKAGFVEYSIIHAYQAPGAYIISYTEANRNEGILNLNNSVNIAFHTQTNLIIDPLTGCFKTPVMLTPSVFTAPADDTLNLSFAALSNEDFILRYELVNPLNIPSGAYTLPENASINLYNGLLTWDTQFMGLHVAGEFLFTIKISYWTKSDDIPKYMGYTLIDTQIILEDSDHSPSIITSKDYGDYGRVYVPAGGTETIRVIYKGIDNENIELKHYTDLSGTPEAFSFTTYDSAENMKVGILTLNSLQVIDREQPYIITVRGLESPQYFPSDVNFMLFTRDIFPEVITSAREDLDWNVYPNPTTGIINIHLPDGESSLIHLMNLQGKKMYDWHNTSSIDISACPVGVYMLEIISLNKRLVTKVIKQ